MAVKNWFANMFWRGPNSTTVGEQDKSLLNLPENKMLALTDCENIYTYWGLGKRIAHALPRFAFSAPREITIGDAPPEAVEEFGKASEAIKQDRMIRRTSVYCRIYGMAGIFAAVDDEKIGNEANLTKAQCRDNRIVFNALNPLNLSGTVFNQDAGSVKFQRPESIRVAGGKVGSKRATVIQNNEPIYLRFSDPTFTFSGVSVYQNMARLIKAWQRSVISLERMGTKASSIVFKEGARGKMSAVQAEAARRSAELLKQMENDGIAVIDKDGDVAFFNLTGVAEVDAILKGLEREILMALDDTPSAILLDKDLSVGLSEGTEEMKAVIMAVENFRNDVLTPLYEWSDPYVMALAWTDEFVAKMRAQYPEKYADFSVAEIRQVWEDSFSYEYGNLYPEKPKTEQELNGIILDNLGKVKAMGADLADIEMEINERKIFLNTMTLDQGNLAGNEFGGKEIPLEENDGEETEKGAGNEKA
jgi:hypothetical protein